MKHKLGLFLIVALALTLIVDLIPSAAQEQAEPSRFINHRGQELFLSGINLAWINFARDLTNFDEPRFIAALDELAAARGNTLRWWLHTQGSASPIYGEDGKVSGITDKEIENFRRALDLAYERGILIMPCLWSFDMLNETAGIPTEWNKLMLEDPEYTQAYIDNALIPLVTAVKGHPGIIAWEVLNEPEGATSEYGWTPVRTEMKSIQQFVNLVAGAIHRTDPEAKVTNGSWSLLVLTDVDGMTNYYRDDRLIEAGGDPDGTLDFYQAHFYPQHFDETVSPFHHPASYWELDKPLVIGEFPAGGIKDLGSGYKPRKPFSNIVKAVEYVWENGYAGALGWSYTDSQFGGMVDLAAGLHWFYRLGGAEHITVDIGDIDHLPTIVSPIPNLIVSNEETGAEVANLSEIFLDREDGTNLKYEVTGNSAPEKVEVTIQDSGVVSLTFAEGALGATTIEITATDTAGNYSKTSFVVQITDPDLGNVALGKPTMASTSENNQYLPEFVTDGLPDTRWSSIYEDNQWLDIDLGAVFLIHQVLLKWEAAYGKAYQIQVWDGEAWQTIFEEMDGNGDIDEALLEEPVLARYVRFSGLERGEEWGFSLWEMEVYGARAEDKDQELPLALTTPTVPEVTQTTPVEPTEVKLVYGFESDTEGWKLADYWAGGKALAFSGENVNEGSSALALALETSGTAWEEGGVFVDPAQPLDLSASTHLMADVYLPEGVEGFIAQIFVKTGEEWTWANSADTALTPGAWTTVTADLSKLGDAADIREVGVKVGTSTTAFKGDVLIDNLVAVTIPQAEAAPVATENELVYGFESDAEGWKLADYWAGGKALAFSSDNVNEGSSALALALETSGTAWEEGGVFIDPAEPFDWSGATTVSADVFVPEGADGFIAQIFVKTGEGWTWANTADTALTAGDWTTITADLSTLGEIGDVREIGVKVGSSTAAFKGDVLIDNIVLTKPIQ